MSTASPRSTPDPAGPADPADWLSAAVDGDAEAIDRACRALREGDAGARARSDWHAYHLIGDVLRSSELASAPRHDAAFLAAFRERLAAEPVVLAPAAVPRAARWRVPAAAMASLAGVAVVAALVLMSRGEGDAGTPLAAAPRAAQPAQATAATTLVRDGVIRDARIEEFMRVHQGAARGLTLQPPGVRQVDLVVAPAPQR